MNNFIVRFLDALPFDGYKSQIGAIGLVIFAVSGIATGMLEPVHATEVALEGLVGLGISHKLVKAVRDILAITGASAPADGS
jgi:hypothetical protein|tara:strand:+ start:2209 stop:2454 length:246 start_codon:yes stop_codon:yes gene_type:complete